jgi:hypothetical protein
MAREIRSEWRCRGCESLLGVVDGGRLHLKYKSAAYAVTGSVATECRKCGLPNVASSPAAV